MIDLVTVRCEEGPIPVQGRMMWKGDVRDGVPRPMVEEILQTRPKAVVIVGEAEAADASPSTGSGYRSGTTEAKAEAAPKRRSRAKRKAAE